MIEDLRNRLPGTTTRLEASTRRRVNEAVAAGMERSVARYACASKQAITWRIMELDQEWEIERTLKANTATIGCAGATLALTVHRKFAWVSTVIGGFLFQHAWQGWGPPIPVLCKIGVRAAREIKQERTALRILRGDSGAATSAMEALRQIRGR